MLRMVNYIKIYLKFPSETQAFWDDTHYIMHVDPRVRTMNYFHVSKLLSSFSIYFHISELFPCFLFIFMFLKIFSGEGQVPDLAKHGGGGSLLPPGHQHSPLHRRGGVLRQAKRDV